MKPFILGAVFARGGSKGLPGKNIKELDGKPLIAYSIEAARAVDMIDDVIVSTDDPQIAAAARKYGASVPFMRPAELATDDAAEVLSWQHAIRTYGQLHNKAVDILVSVPTTSPLRRPEDIVECLNLLTTTDADIVVTITEGDHNPYFNMVKLDNEGHVSVAIQSPAPIVGRQKAPKVYDMTAVCYAVRVNYVLEGKRLFEGKVRAVKIPKERAVDIDTPLDFELAEFFLKRNKL